MRDPDRGRRDRAGNGLDLSSPALWAFLGEFPAAGLALGAWVHDDHVPSAAGRDESPGTDRRP